ncbi:MAG: hypothetical protein K2Q26_08330 [Bdellovibrionales bacterium]|nr:hypothetical protein [Bdellovibrionales bacterium]
MKFFVEQWWSVYPAGVAERCKKYFYWTVFIASSFITFGKWSRGSEFFEPVSFYQWILPSPLSDSVLAALGGMWRVSLVLAALSLWPKISHLVAFLLGLFLLGYSGNFGKVSHGYNLMVMTLGFCGVHTWLVTEGSRRFLDTWLFRAVQVMTVVIYFQAGIMKLYVSGLDWALTPHLQIIFEERGMPLGLWAAQFPWLCQWLAFSTLLLEVLAPFALLAGPLWWLPVSFWIAMHVGIHLLIGANFYPQLATFLFWYYPQTPMRSVGSEASPRRNLALGVLILCAGTSLSHMIFQKKNFPFSSFSLFSSIEKVVYRWDLEVRNGVTGQFESVPEVYFRPLTREKFYEIIENRYETTKNWQGVDPEFRRFARLVIRNLREKKPPQNWQEVQLVVIEKSVGERSEISPRKIVLSANIIDLEKGASL